MTNGGESEERAHSRLITLGLSFTLFTLTPHHLPLPAGGRQGEVRGKIESDVRPTVPAAIMIPFLSLSSSVLTHFTSLHSTALRSVPFVSGP